jgi:hypothetical protein
VAAVNVLVAVHAGLGGMCLAAPDAVPGLAHPLDRRTRRFLRILGARHLIQAGFVGASPTASRHRIGAGIDAVHAATMLVLAAADRRRRRPALLNAVAALALAGADFRAAGGLR